MRTLSDLATVRSLLLLISQPFVASVITLLHSFWLQPSSVNYWSHMLYYFRQQTLQVLITTKEDTTPVSDKNEELVSAVTGRTKYTTLSLRNESNVKDRVALCLFVTSRRVLYTFEFWGRRLAFDLYQNSKDDEANSWFYSMRLIVKTFAGCLRNMERSRPFSI
jgi:hypothetical protein